MTGVKKTKAVKWIKTQEQNTNRNKRQSRNHINKKEKIAYQITSTNP
jgi:hypothetical protein